MKKYVVMLLFSVFSYSYSQDFFDTKCENCEPISFYVEGDVVYAQKDIAELYREMFSCLDTSQLKEIRGEIKIQLFIDTLGKPCCISMKNSLNHAGKNVDLGRIINDSTKWTSPKMDGEVVPICTFLKIEFTEEKIILQRQGFNRKLGGFIVLSMIETIK